MLITHTSGLACHKIRQAGGSCEAPLPLRGRGGVRREGGYAIVHPNPQAGPLGAQVKHRCRCADEAVCGAEAAMVERLAAEGLLTPNNGALDPGAQRPSMPQGPSVGDGAVGCAGRGRKLLAPVGGALEPLMD